MKTYYFILIFIFSIYTNIFSVYKYNQKNILIWNIYNNSSIENNKIDLFKSLLNKELNFYNFIFLVDIDVLKKFNGIEAFDELKIFGTQNRIDYILRIYFENYKKIFLLNIDIISCYNDKKYDLISIEIPNSNEKTILKIVKKLKIIIFKNIYNINIENNKNKIFISFALIAEILYFKHLLSIHKNHKVTKKLPNPPQFP